MLSLNFRTIVLCAFLCLSFQFLSSQAITWASKIDYGDGTPTNSAGGVTMDIDVDLLGNSVSCGIAWGTVDFTGGVISTAPLSLGYIAKHDPLGNLIWARRFSGGSGGTMYDVETNANGDVYFATTWSGAQDFWGIPVPAQPSLTHGAILGKFDAAGNIQWIKTYPGTGQAKLYELTEAPNGDIFMIGTFSSTLDLAGQTMTSAGVEDAFISRVDPNGNILWTEQLEGNFSYYGTFWLDATTDPSGNLIMSTFLVDSARIDNQVHVANGGGDMLLVKYDGNGNHLWTKQEGGPALDFPSGVGTDATGNIYWTGEFKDSVDFGGNMLLGQGIFEEIWIAKMDPSGNVIWANSGGSSSQDRSKGMAVKPNGEFFISGVYGSNATFGSVSIAPNNSAANFFVLKGDANGNALWGKGWGNPGFGGPNNGSPIALELDPQGNPRVAGYFTGLFDFNGIQLQQTGQNADGFVFSVLDNSNLITGEVYRDFNQNGMADAGDTGFPGAIVEMTPGPRYYLSGQAGEYQAGTDVGNYNLEIPNPPLYHTVTAPTSHTANFPTLGLVDSLNDFGLYPIPNVNDLRISLTPYHTPRPGDTIYYVITVKNVGTTTLTPDVAFLPPSQLVYGGSTPNFQTTLNDTLFWTLPALAPQDEEHIVLRFEVPLIPIIALGDTLYSYAYTGTAAGDTTPVDNVTDLTQIIVGSYDPNDKTVFPAGSIEPTDVAAGMWLDYTIRFQNTGTDTAFQVVVRDTLDPNLDIPTFEMIATSHDYSVNMSGLGEISWRFNNINLPDSNVNEPGSHGFIRYRIRPKTTLALGSTIQNTAHIYFDYNPAIVTNTTVNTVEVMTSQTEALLNGLSVQVYPNPSKGRFTVQLQAEKAGTLSARLYDLQGRKLSEYTWKHGAGRVAQAVDCGLAPGMYLLELESAGQRSTRRLVVQ